MTESTGTANPDNNRWECHFCKKNIVIITHSRSTLKNAWFIGQNLITKM